MANVVVDFDNISNPLSILQSITTAKQHLRSSREGNDIYLRFPVNGKSLTLHLQRGSIDVMRFHINDNQQSVWSINEGEVKRGYLGLGESYLESVGDVTNIDIGFLVFGVAVREILYNFSDDGSRVSVQRSYDAQAWNKSISYSLASLIVMAVETCRFDWLFEDVSDVLMNRTTSRVNNNQGEMINSWEHISDTSRRQTSDPSRWTWRSSPVDEGDVDNARNNPLYARSAIGLPSRRR